MGGIRKGLSLVLAAALIVGAGVYTAKPQNEVKAATGWNLVWSDEFNGSSLDTSVWGFDIGTGQDGWGNGEVQYYTNRSDNIYVSGGNLNIKAKREWYNNSNFTSARINSKNRKAFKYGRMEAKIKVDGGNQDGVWPAFWMMGNDYDSVGWPSSGELDIMEHANSNNYVEGTLHWGPIWNQHSSWGSFSDGKYGYYSDNVNNGINGWHTYGIEWDSNYIKWFLDDNYFLTASIGDGFDSQPYFNKEHFFILNLALGGTGTGYTAYKTPDANFSEATMLVDYVRAYQWGEITNTTTQATTTASEIPSGFTKAQNNSWQDVGAWKYYFGQSWAGSQGAYKGGNNLNDFSIYMTEDATADWGAQIKPDMKLEANTKYNYNITIDSDAGGKKVSLVRDLNQTGQGNLIDENLINGTKIYTGSFATGSEAGEELIFNLTQIGKGKTFTIKNFSVSKASETTTQAQTTTQKQTTTKAQTTTQKQTTTKAQTTTQKQTTTRVPITVAPTNQTTNNQTTKPSTTKKKVAPTTKKKVKPIKRVKIKKIKKKKRSLKVTIKKVKGVKGYHVLYSDEKSFDGYYEKYTRKTKFKLKKLARKTKYYIMVRAYRIQNGVRVYGAFSKKKKAKTK